MNKAIIIIGPICSGKSTLAADVSDITPHSTIVSFGDYLKNYCKNRSIKYDRKVLQDVGQQLINEGAGRFLRSVVAFAQPSEEKTLIFEGVRHSSVFKEIKSISTSFKSIYLDINAEIRYTRYISRNRGIDSVISYDEFVEIDNHVVELEIEHLKSKCELILSHNPTSLEKIKEYIT